MAINSDSFLYSYLLDKKEPFKPTKEDKAVKVPLKGIDFTTGQSIDLNNYQAFLPQKPEDVLGGAEFPVFKEDEVTTPDTSPFLDERQEYLDMLDRSAARRQEYALQALRESALLQAQLSGDQFNEFIPTIQRLTEAAKYADLGRQLEYDKTSPTKLQDRILRAQTGEAGLMQAIAGQAHGAKAMSGGYSGKNVHIV